MSVSLLANMIGFRKTILSLVISVSVVAGALSVSGAFTNQDLLNLFEQRKDVQPEIIKAYQKAFIPEAWHFVNERAPQLSNVVVGIVDSGVDSKHPEFVNPSVNFGSSTVSDLVDSGISLDGTISTHGTNVAGIIGANNLSATSSANYTFPQMNGVASGVRNISYSIESRRLGILTLFDARRAISDFSRRQVSVVNISRATSFGLVGNLFLKGPIEKAVDVFFVVSAGNSDVSADGVSPATLGNDLDNVITIGATDLDNARASFSNFGSAVNMAAPGVNVYSPTFFIPPLGLGDYDPTFSGTSASAPMVTGVAAILKALEPEYQKYTPGLVMSPARIKEILVSSGDPIDTDKPIGPRLNAHRAVAWLFPPTAVQELRATTTTTESVDLEWSLPPDSGFQNPDFASYKIFRSTSPDVDTSDTLVATITDPAQTTYTDANLTPNTTFFYKAFVFDKAGLSAASNEVSAATLPVAEPPAAVSLSQIYPSLTTGDYIGLFWTKSNETDFAYYKIFRNDALIATIANQNQIYFKDAGLAPGTYLYKVFVEDQDGLSAASNELSGRVFGSEEVVTRIPGVPEPGDSGLPANTAIPGFVFGINLFDCPRNSESPFSCTGPFTVVSQRVDGHGHLGKFRSFSASVAANLLNDTPGLHFILHHLDTFHLNLVASDDSYLIFIPPYGIRGFLPQGVLRVVEAQVFAGSTTNIITQASGGAVNESAGFLTVVP